MIEIGIAIEIEHGCNTHLFDTDFDSDFDSDFDPDENSSKAFKTQLMALDSQRCGENVLYSGR
jgi:hypothetical protein